jgi:hypothetical protein
VHLSAPSIAGVGKSMDEQDGGTLPLVVMTVSLIGSIATLHRPFNKALFSASVVPIGMQAAVREGRSGLREARFMPHFGRAAAAGTHLVAEYFRPNGFYEYTFSKSSGTQVR